MFYTSRRKKWMLLTGFSNCIKISRLKILIFLIMPFLMGCALNQRITYNTKDLEAPWTVNTISIMVEVRILEDNRTNIKENDVLFNNPRKIEVKGVQTCINSEEHYTRQPVANQLTQLLVNHFNKARLFRMTYYDRGHYSDYYITGTLNRFYSEQEFSPKVAAGANFGLVGYMSTAGIKTPGKVIIEISDFKLYRKDGTLIKDFGTIHRELIDDFNTEAYCWSAYHNINAALRIFNINLIEKIRNELAHTEF